MEIIIPVLIAYILLKQLDKIMFETYKKLNKELINEKERFINILYLFVDELTDDIIEYDSKYEWLNILNRNLHIYHNQIKNNNSSFDRVRNYEDVTIRKDVCIKTLSLVKDEIFKYMEIIKQECKNDIEILNILVKLTKQLELNNE